MLSVGKSVRYDNDIYFYKPPSNDELSPLYGSGLTGLYDVVYGLSVNQGGLYFLIIKNNSDVIGYFRAYLEKLANAGPITAMDSSLVKFLEHGKFAIADFLIIKECFQHRGIGSSVLDFFEAELKEQGYNGYAFKIKHSSQSAHSLWNRRIVTPARVYSNVYKLHANGLLLADMVATNLPASRLYTHFFNERIVPFEVELPLSS